MLGATKGPPAAGRGRAASLRVLGESTAHQFGLPTPEPRDSTLLLELAPPPGTTGHSRLRRLPPAPSATGPFSHQTFLRTLHSRCRHLHSTEEKRGLRGAALHSDFRGVSKRALVGFAASIPPTCFYNNTPSFAGSGGDPLPLSAKQWHCPSNPSPVPDRGAAEVRLSSSMATPQNHLDSFQKIKIISLASVPSCTAPLPNILVSSVLGLAFLRGLPERF